MKVHADESKTGHRFFEPCERFSYDDRGNVIHNGQRDFQFNRANQLIRSGSIGYQYDGHGLRVKKTVASSTYTVYDLSGALLLTDSQAGQTRHIHLGKELIAKNGMTSEPTDSPGYTSHLQDHDLSLTYMQQRYYDPVIGRFYSNDPVGFSADSPMMFNRYAYANNNPYKFVDPDGRKPGDLFNSPEEAGRDAVASVNQKSIKENVEYLGTIDKMTSIDSQGNEVTQFVASEPKQGSETGVKLEANIKTVVGDYHTHGDYSKKGENGQIERTTKANDEFNSDNFSLGDVVVGVTFAEKTADFRGDTKYIKVLGTPSGEIKTREFK